MFVWMDVCMEVCNYVCMRCAHIQLINQSINQSSLRLLQKISSDHKQYVA